MEKLFGLARYHNALGEAYVSGNYKPLSELKVRRIIQTTPGSWPAGTTIEDILNQMEGCDLIIRGTPFGKKEPIVIPLAR